jgi:adenine-specific DNA-methyltransferase
MNDKTKNTRPINDLGYSPDALAQRQAELLALIRQVVPEVMADNQIDPEKLKEFLGHDRIAPDEHYELNWAGKSAARREIQKTSSLTLLPDPNNPPHAQHMLIEGENLEVLRVLQKSYYGKVKMIYIDPPYNTGNDSFVYPDDYSETLEDYQRRTGEKNEAGYLNKQSLWKKNSKESGQYHSAWLSMMYPRLYLARNLLREDGVIFISIDDNEVQNLKLLCDEIFGSENFVGIFIKPLTGGKAPQFIKVSHEYLLCYVKKNENISLLSGRIEALSSDSSRSLRKDGDADRRSDRPDMYYCIYASPVTGHLSLDKFDGSVEIYPRRPDGSDGRWRWGKEKFKLEKNRLKLKEKKGVWDIEVITVAGTIREHPWESIIQDNLGSGGAFLTEIFSNNLIFSYPKNPNYIKWICSTHKDKDGIYLDFFAGSGTTAQAVIELNQSDGGNRKCISVQMPEVLEENSEAYKAGYRTIADITRARINKVITRLKTEYPDRTKDLACAHFTLAPSNFKVWRGEVDSAASLREQLSIFQSAEKVGKSQVVDVQAAMLTELLLKHGLGAFGVNAISKPREVAGVTVHRVLMVDDKTMWLCFETYTDALKDEIVKNMPAQVVMLNSCFVGPKADEHLANLQLELAGLDIGLTVI